MAGRTENPKPFSILLGWLDTLSQKRGIIGSGRTGKTKSNFPEGYLKVIRVLSGIGNDHKGSEGYELAKSWEDKVKKENEGVFDPVVLYDLMLGESSGPKND
ncbi:hypothetical protein A2714_02250 [Candidatus Woesebacteria bacterium RIFCSPHIGHO2_01_FULL_38_9]|uniref:Uncharacterized protein n=1 Tax=Candidatus Woesebacteria bacterium RIFCSPHIGHO2_01_FULL_38_9 TaxID=1802492 RepID=A0A1F7Y0Y2_9BACT|nr:MAG: hypothetical protein A2714_02250 [Candidatus Woesebacteria bacterium RIFCSPHIGHO2_01_FULL_38_9]